MRTRTLLLTTILSTAVVLAGCERPAKVIVLDSWWDTDYAKDYCRKASDFMTENRSLIAQLGCQSVTACPEMMSVTATCATDSAGHVREFEDALVTQFATTSGCLGIEVVRIGDPDKSTSRTAGALNGRHWALTMDFRPGATSQSWSIVTPNDSVLKGSGNLVEIAMRVCALVGARGAEVTD